MAARAPLQRPTRERVTTIDNDGSRIFLHPADVKGKFTTARRWFGYVLIVLYLVLPWIPVKGHPALFLDIANRRFHILGTTFTAQDLWLTFFLITGVGFSLFVLSALFGRLWCGWACPQTVFLEHVYRRIERWIEGDAAKRRRLDKAPWTTAKVIKRCVKHFAFVLVSLVIAHSFSALFVSWPQLWGWMLNSPLEHWSAFLFIIVTSGALYFNFAWFREQLCLVICPYGRLQSALADDDTLLIGYDEKRGEPRGKATLTGIGDCVDCNRCVQVCPTGIDIRQGLQIECIGCAACIDACDTIMTKLGRPTGLIRYDSLNGLSGRKRRFIRPRIFLYLALIAVGASVMLFSISRITSANMNVVRMTGAPYFITDNGLRNQYMVRVINKTEELAEYRLVALAEGQQFTAQGIDEPLHVKPMEELLRPLVISISKEDYHGQFPLELQLLNEAGEVIKQAKVEFLGPNPALLK